MRGYKILRVRNSYNAYFTVEASLLFPMILLFTTMMIFMSFYVYDRCMLETCAYEAALRGCSNHIKSNEEAYKKTVDAANYLIKDKIFADSYLNSSVEVTALEVKVEYECKVNMPMVTWLSQFVPNADFAIHVTKSAPRDHQVDVIRAIRIVKDKVN